MSFSDIPAKSLAQRKTAEEAPSVRGAVDSREAITWANIRRSWQAYALLAPILCLLLIFNYYPPLLGLVRAFYEWMPTRDAVFVGLENFRNYLLHYPEAGREFANVARFLSLRDVRACWHAVPDGRIHLRRAFGQYQGVLSVPGCLAHVGAPNRSYPTLETYI